MNRLTIAGLRDIVGADRGFNVAADILTKTADGTSLDSIWSDFQTSLGLWNRTRSALAALFTLGIYTPTENIAIDGNKIDLEQASEFGVPKAGRVIPGYYPVGFDLRWYDTASRYTRKFLRDATAAQVNTQHVGMLEADNRLIFNTVMSAIMTPTGGSFGARATNPEGNTIYSLYSGANDDTPPQSPDGTTFAANHQHYLVSGAAVVDSSDLEDVMSKVTEHGRGMKIYGEQLVVIVNKAEATEIRKFRAGQTNNNAAVATYDFIATAEAPAYLTTETLVGSRPPAVYNGLDVAGSYGDALIVVHPLAKAGYMVAVASGGEQALGFREHPVAENRGFRLVQGAASMYPLIDSVYERGFGVGVRRREAAAVVQIKAAGAYVAPVWS